MGVEHGALGVEQVVDVWACASLRRNNALEVLLVTVECQSLHFAVQATVVGVFFGEVVFVLDGVS